MKSEIVVIGAGSIGQAIARRVSSGKHVLLSDLRQENADAAARTLADAGFAVSTATVDVSSRASVQALVATATGLGDIVGLIHAAGVSPPNRRWKPSSGSTCWIPQLGASARRRPPKPDLSTRSACATW